MLGIDAETLFEAPGLAAYVLVVAGLFGLVMGSFLNCWAWRMTHGESILRGRSHCDSCGHVLGAADLVPVASWAASHGRCRYCGAHISARCPATELACCALYVTIVARYGLTAETLELLCLASALFVASLTDIDEFVIPNGCVVFALVVRLLYLLYVGFERVALPAEGAGAVGAFSLLDVLTQAAWAAKPYVLSALAVGVALVVLAIIMDHVLGRDSLGGGDVKLLAVAALYVGWQQCLLLLLVACVLGIIVGIVQLHGSGAAEEGVPDADAAPSTAHDEEMNAGAAGGAGDARAGDGNAGSVEAGASGAEAGAPEDGRPDDVDARAFPWGPSIALATWFVLLFGQQIVNAYLGLFI